MVNFWQLHLWFYDVLWSSELQIESDTICFHQTWRAGKSLNQMEVFIGKSLISMVPLSARHEFMRVNPQIIHQFPLHHHFPMVFPGFSLGERQAGPSQAISVYRQAADRMAKAASLCPEGIARVGGRGGGGEQTPRDRLDLWWFMWIYMDLWWFMCFFRKK